MALQTLGGLRLATGRVSFYGVVHFGVNGGRSQRPYAFINGQGKGYGCGSRKPSVLKMDRGSNPLDYGRACHGSFRPMRLVKFQSEDVVVFQIVSRHFQIIPSIIDLPNNGFYGLSAKAWQYHLCDA